MELEKIEDILNPYLLEHNLSLYEIKWVKEYGYQILRVSIEKAGGIDIDTLAMVNDYLSDKLDAFENELPDYMLEVCSPGAEKPLRSKEEVLDSINKYVNIKTDDMVYEGTLLSFTEDVLVVKINIKGRVKNVSINYGDIKRIRLAVKL